MRKDRNRFLKDFKLQKLQKGNTDLKDAPIVGVDSIYQQFISKFNSSSDLCVTEFPHLTVKIYYFSYLINKDQYEQFLATIRNITLEELQTFLNHSGFKELSDINSVEEAILSGNGILFTEKHAYELPFIEDTGRAIAPSETESVILGAHDAFVESIDVNLSLIRKRVMSSQLKTIKLHVGNKAKRKVYLLYIEGEASDDDIEEIKKRILSIKNDAIVDTNMLVQYIDEHPNSPFPQFYTTERPDVIAYKLFDGKIAGLMDNSPFAFCTPVSFFDFMESMDDFGQRWIVSTFIKVTRYIAILVTLIFTAFYVAVTTYHYEMIPQALLPTLLESRSKVPFPPVIEALFLEFLLELLREAGARLPTKVGQTIGIVGGIVIGQAAVQAGITSNILIIVVAASAIASFVVPSYLLSTSIRIVRFGFIILSGFWGNLGIIFGMGILIIHLSCLTNLNSPYLLPISPMYPRFFKYSLIRGPFKKKAERG
ncbi:spore germination protein [Bacillus sp. EB106-08-02-XG196]|uniref:spore germination protein n=1 Tax=Bacillus sp. EB106-08-02-XG196 TaxID=2737049 RepID=UPI0015C47FB4|nr:spore germination protein [Bacillus sp. EB106-08-02-XG196]NWQ43771.1 spore germination protein [Bacillus sp. EB106-08-02-XG196]